MHHQSILNQHKVKTCSGFPTELLTLINDPGIKETPCVPLRGGGTQGVSALKPERYLGTPQVLESLVYQRSKTGLLVCSGLLVQNTLGNSLVQLTVHKTQSLNSSFLVLCLNSSLDLAGRGLQLGLYNVVAQASLLVGEDTLLLRLNVSHN